MAWKEPQEQIDRQDENSILRELDRGIDDMEAGRELPLEEAFREIAGLRMKRRSARV